MARDSRVELIKKIEAARSSHVITYATADRQPFRVQIAEDAVRPIYGQLLRLPDRSKRIDLFLYSRGGDVSVPWRIVTAIREFCDEFSVLVPYKAHSAATMICLGADEIVMTRKAELGPIDPTLTKAAANGDSNAPPPEVSVEDVSSYIAFMRDRAGITDQAALSQVVSQLAAHLTPLTLGSVNRQYSHIRMLARKLLTSRSTKQEETRINGIIEALTEKIYSHGHAIGRKEATELGLPVVNPAPDLEKDLWSLYQEYEDFLKLNNPLDFEETLLGANADEKRIDGIALAVIESVQEANVFETNGIIKRRRQVPPNPQFNLNVSLNVPGFNPQQQLPANLQPILQNLVQQVLQALPGLVQNEIVRQSPVIGFEYRGFGGKWVQK